MSRIIVIGGTGYAGSAIVKEAAARGHKVTSLSRSLPDAPTPDVAYVQGDAADEATLSKAISDAEVVVGALAPRGPLADTFLDVYATVARLADAGGAPLFVVGGSSSLRPAPGAKRFIEDLSQVPAPFRDVVSNLPEEFLHHIRAVAALITEILPATPATLDWVYVCPPFKFGADMPGEQLGRYRLGDDVAVQPEDGGTISAADFALGFVDLIESGNHHRTQVNVAH